MDRKSIIVLVLCFLALMLWGPLVNYIYPPVPIQRTNAPASTLTNAPAAVATTDAPPALSAAVPVVLTNGITVLSTNIPDHELEFANATAHYTFTSRGGGLARVELLQFPETVQRRSQQADQTNRYATLNDHSPNPTLAILGPAELVGDGAFQLSRTDHGVRAEKVLSNGLAIIKDFRIGSNYLVTTTVRIENRSGQPLAVPAQEWVVGTGTPMGPRDDPTTIGLMWFNGSSTENVGAAWFENRRMMGCYPGTPRPEYRAGVSNVVWAAAHNQFFTLALMPKDPALQVIARKTELPRPTGEAAKLVATNAPAPVGFYTTVAYPGLILPANAGFDREVTLFAGPKEYQTLMLVGAQLKNKADLIMGYGGPFGFFAKALLLAMNWMHETVSFSYGVAIVVITVIIKLLFWPLTQASTRSMKRLQALQPQMAAIREKYKDDPVKMNRKTMEFMRENKVSPLGGCLPMLLQIPVFFGFYQMIRSAIELRGAGFLWVLDLSKPDTLFVIPNLGFIPFIGIPGVGLPFNLLPLIMGVTMFWQARLTPPSPGMDPVQQKIMKYMPMMFMVFLYNFSAGLTLYWTVQNLLTIAQTKLTRTKEPAPGAPGQPAAVLTKPQKKRK